MAAHVPLLLVLLMENYGSIPERELDTWPLRPRKQVQSLPSRASPNAGKR